MIAPASPTVSPFPYLLRNFTAADAAAVDALALEAFAEYRDAYDDWPAVAAAVGRMSALAAQAEILVADGPAGIVGAVAYLGPDRPRQPIFDPAWAVMRLLVVAPRARGAGLGRTLAEECIDRARGDGAPLIALHTSPIMAVALALYLRLDFRLLRPAPAVHGVPYGIYGKSL